MAFQLPPHTFGTNWPIFNYALVPQIGLITMDSAAKRAGFLFQARVSENVTGFVFATGGNTGTVTNGCTAELYAVDTNGFPTGSVLATATFTPSGTTYNTVTFSAAYAVTAGVVYAIILKNVLGTPASNYFRLCATGSASMSHSCLFSAFPLLTSPDSGTYWGTLGTNLFGSFQGSLNAAPIYSTFGTDWIMMNGANFNAGSALLYGTGGVREARHAIKVNFPRDVYLHWFNTTVYTYLGTPAGNLYGEVCSSDAVLATSQTVFPAIALSTGSTRVGFSFGTPYLLRGGVDYYIGVMCTGGGTSSNTLAISCSGKYATTDATIGPVKNSYYSTAAGAPSWTVETATIGACAFNVALSLPDPFLMVHGMRGGFNG